MARSYVAREIVKLGGQPVWRENCITDNHNQILDVHNLDIMEPIKLNRSSTILSRGHRWYFCHAPC